MIFQYQATVVVSFSLFSYTFSDLGFYLCLVLHPLKPIAWEGYCSVNEVALQATCNSDLSEMKLCLNLLSLYSPSWYFLIWFKASERSEREMWMKNTSDMKRQWIFRVLIIIRLKKLIALILHDFRREKEMYHVWITK